MSIIKRFIKLTHNVFSDLIYYWVCFFKNLNAQMKSVLQGPDPDFYLSNSTYL